MTVDLATVVGDVVPREHGQQNDVGRIFGHAVLQDQDLLGRAVAIDCEAQNLGCEPFRLEATGKPAFHHLPEHLVQRHLTALGERIAEHGHTQGVGRFLLAMIDVAEAFFVDGDPGAALHGIDASDFGSGRPTEQGVKSVEFRVGDVRDPQANFRDQERQRHAGDDDEDVGAFQRKRALRWPFSNVRSIRSARRARSRVANQP